MSTLEMEKGTAYNRYIISQIKDEISKDMTNRFKSLTMFDILRSRVDFRYPTGL